MIGLKCYNILNAPPKAGSANISALQVGRIIGIIYI